MSTNDNNTIKSKDEAPKGKAKRRKRGGGRNNWDRKKSGAPRGPPQTPQLKVTIRNIHNAEQNGTVRNVGDRILRKLIQLSSEKLNVPSPDRISLQFDEVGLRALADADEAARNAQEEWKAKQSTEVKTLKTNEATDEKAVADEKEQSKTHGELPPAVVEGMEQLSLSNPVIDETSVHVRVLYVVPPKKTKRRGEKTGCAYLVLTAPPIAAREPPRTLENPESHAEDAASTRSIKSGSDSVSVDYTQDIARRRLMIQLSLEALVKTAEEDAKSRQEFSECVVEESLSGKTWKARTDNIRRDRMEGTIEETADYKAFFEQSEKDKEERKSRPKPAPGGGVSSSAMSANNSSSGGQPIATLVLHLRKKQEEEKKRKQGSRVKQTIGAKDPPKLMQTAKKGKAKTRPERERRNQPPVWHPPLKWEAAKVAKSIGVFFCSVSSE